ncbi:MAG: energy-coupling factor transporter transmembrane protein EcfT [Clostridia bacterium]|nr:energy-coupling factor transporter transmembrane protein EcfT [Clostridia bacterium]
MQNRDAFAAYHPLVNFLYFGAVIGFTMVFLHPVCLGISLVCAVLYHRRLYMGQWFRFFAAALPLLVLTALLNPMFNHQGTVILAYLPGGNPLTLESMLYGIAAAVMLITVLLWFRCYTAVMTSDKFVYLFGRFLPSLSLLLSMTLRFVPKFRRQLARVREAQVLAGRDPAAGSKVQRLRNATSCFSATVTWALESAAETADSMKSRGYGLKGRTAFSIYRFTDRDKTALFCLLIAVVGLVACAAAGGMYWRYFPNIRGQLAAPFTVFFQIMYFCMCGMPLVIDREEERRWILSRSKI